MKPDKAKNRKPDDDGESGHTSVLILGVTLVILMFASVILGATAVTSEARRLLATADGVASAAASEVPTGAVLPTADAAQIGRSAQNHLVAVEADTRHRGLEISAAEARDEGQSVYIQLRASVEIPVLRWVLPAEVTVTADSQARVTVLR